jgi:hypothetical protein
MDPLLFGIKGDVVAEVLGAIVLLSLIIERFFAPIFEWRVVLSKIADKGVKEPVVLLASFLVVYFYEFDAMAVIFTQEQTSFVGYLITAGVVAGGSKGSIALFRDFLGWKSTAQKEREVKAKKALEQK